MRKFFLLFRMFAIYGIQISLYIIVYNFSLVNYEYYISHYKDFLKGHILSMIFLFILYFIGSFSYFRYKKYQLKESLIKTAFVILPAFVCMIIYILYSIDYSLIINY
jgi:hypothetical protein